MNSNLTNLLEKLSKEEWESFGDFISSPYFVKGRDYSGLYKILKNYFLGNKRTKSLDETIEKSKIAKSMSPQAFNNRLAEFNKLAERFLVQRNMESHFVAYYAMLFEELVNRDLYPNFKTNFNSARNKIKPVDAEDFIPYSKILQAHGFYFRNNNDIVKAFSMFDEHVDCMNAYFLDRMLYFATEYYLSEAFGLKYDADIFLKTFSEINIHKLIEKIEASDSKYYESVLMRYYVYNALINPDKPYLIEKAEKFFEKIRDRMSLDLKIDYFQKMQANLVQHINKSEFSYLRKLFDLLIARLEDKDTINFSLADYPAAEFRDFVVIGLKVKEYNWVEDFIKEYSKHLHPSFREEEKSIALIKLYAEKKDYIRALRIINNQKRTKNHVHSIDLYKYKIMIYYEMKYFDELELIVDNLRHFLQKEGLVEIQKNATIDFAGIMNRLIKIYKNPLREGLVEFIQELNSSKKYISDKKWFLEKANELFA